MSGSVEIVWSMCMTALDENCFAVLFDHSTLWLHGLYINIQGNSYRGLNSALQVPFNFIATLYGVMAAGCYISLQASVMHVIRLCHHSVRTSVENAVATLMPSTYRCRLQTRPMLSGYWIVAKLQDECLWGVKDGSHRRDFPAKPKQLC